MFFFNKTQPKTLFVLVISGAVKCLIKLPIDLHRVYYFVCRVGKIRISHATQSVLLTPSSILVQVNLINYEENDEFTFMF